MSRWLAVAMTGLVVCFISPTAANAAQDAVVVLDQAPIRENPAPDAKVIQSLPSGSKIRISSFTKNGWYKTKVQNGPVGQNYGWIWQSDLEVSAMSSDLKAANLALKDNPHERRSRSEPRFFIKAGGLLFGILSADVSTRLGLGAGHWFFAPGGFGEAAVAIDERLRLALRVAAYSSSSSVSFSSTTYNVTLSGVPVLFGIDADVTQNTVFDVAAGIYAGMAFNNTLTVGAPALPLGNEFTVQGNNYAFLINFSGKYHFSRHFSAIVEAGVYYSRISGAQVPAGFNGDAPFRDDAGNLSILTVNHLGPMLSLGLQLAL